jgi:hypothetical protein
MEALLATIIFLAAVLVLITVYHKLKKHDFERL